MSSNIKKPYYLDYQSTTPIDPRVIDEMTRVMKDEFGNPHSRSHEYGWRAEEITEIARENVAKVINADAKDIIFTSGATESNNIAIRSLAEFNEGKKNHIITLATEHKCVINTCRYLSERGWDITFLPVKEDGLVDLKVLEGEITDKTLLISVMAVNNEIGVIQPLKAIGNIAKNHGVFFHTDAAQAFGKIELDVDEMGIDLMSISGHKIYGPKGIGALYVRKKPLKSDDGKKKPRVRLVPFVQGGGQERNFRSGTLAPFLCAGLGKASEVALKEMKQDQEKVKKIYDRFKKEIFDELDEIYLNGSGEYRYYGNINLSFRFIEGESMIMAIKDLAVSSGSACTSASLEPSYVLKALGRDDEMAHTSIRFGFGRFTTDEEIDYAIPYIKNKVEHLRNMSPLWEMHQEGIDLSTVDWGDHHDH